MARTRICLPDRSLERKREVLSETSCQQVSGAGGYCGMKEQSEEVSINSNFGLELIFLILF